MRHGGWCVARWINDELQQVQQYSAQRTNKTQDDELHLDLHVYEAKEFLPDFDVASSSQRHDQTCAKSCFRLGAPGRRVFDSGQMRMMPRFTAIMTP